MITYIDGCLSKNETKRLESKLIKNTLNLPKKKGALFTKDKDKTNVEVTGIAKSYSEVLSVYDFINDNFIKTTLNPSGMLNYGIKRLDYISSPCEFKCIESNNYFNITMDHNFEIHINVLTIILFLNSCDNRKVIFPHLEESFKPKKGHAICFPTNNIYSNYSPKSTDNYRFLKYTIGYDRSFPSL